jgi:hypothetical protein
MNNLMHKISDAVKCPRQSRQRWSVQIVIALSFVIIALGSLMTDSVRSNWANAQIVQERKPVITGISPSQGPTGTTVTITGANLLGSDATLLLGETLPDPIVHFDGLSHATATLVSKSATKLVVLVPTGVLGICNVTVETNAGTSDAVGFNVTSPPPVIDNIDPDSGSVGSQVTITGTNLLGSSNTFVGPPDPIVHFTAQIGTKQDTIATLVSKSAASLVVRVPLVVPGSYQVTVETNVGTSKAKTFMVLAGAAIVITQPAKGDHLINRNAYLIKWHFNQLPDAEFRHGTVTYLWQDSPAVVAPVFIGEKHFDNLNSNISYEYSWTPNFASDSLPRSLVVLVKYVPDQVFPGTSIGSTSGVFTMNQTPADQQARLFMTAFNGKINSGAFWRKSSLLVNLTRTGITGKITGGTLLLHYDPTKLSLANGDVTPATGVTLGTVNNNPLGDVLVNFTVDANYQLVIVNIANFNFSAAAPGGQTGTADVLLQMDRPNGQGGLDFAYIFNDVGVNILAGIDEPNPFVFTFYSISADQQVRLKLDYVNGNKHIDSSSLTNKAGIKVVMSLGPNALPAHGVVALTHNFMATKLAAADITAGAGVSVGGVSIDTPSDMIYVSFTITDLPAGVTSVELFTANFGAASVGLVATDQIEILYWATPPNPLPTGIFPSQILDADGNDILGGVDDPNKLVLNISPIVVPPRPLSGTYHSRIIPFDADHPGLGLSSLGNFTLKAFWDSSLNAAGNMHSNVRIGVKFFGANDNPLGNPSGSYEHWLTIAADPNGATIPAEQIDAMFKDYSWFNDIRKVQFVIEITSADVNSAEVADQPWVETVSLGYELNAVEVGIINFAVGEATHKIVAAGGASVTFNMTATPLAGFDSQAKRVDLGIDWGGAAPVGVSYVINPSFIYPFSPTTPVTSVDFVVTFTADTGAEIDVDHNFSVTGHLAGELERILRPAAGTLSVSGEINPTGDFTIEFVGEHVRSVRPGGSAVYQILVKSINDFSEAVTLSTDVLTKFTSGSLSTPQFTPSATVIPTGGDGSLVLLSIGINSTAENQGPALFGITGTAGELTHSLTTGSLEIDDQAPEQPAITISATVPMETERTTTYPQFVFRLYPDNATSRIARVYQKTSILPSEFNDQDQVTIEVPEGLVEHDQKYVGYIKSTRHLWAKSTNDFTVDAFATTQSYALTFPTLVAGNVGPTPDASEFLEDDQINVLDWTTWLMELAGAWATRYADFNNDGAVNTADINYILGDNGAKWFKSGDLQTKWPL